MLVSSPLPNVQATVSRTGGHGPQCDFFHAPLLGGIGNAAREMHVTVGHTRAVGRGSIAFYLWCLLLFVALYLCTESCVGAHDRFKLLCAFQRPTPSCRDRGVYLKARVYSQQCNATVLDKENISAHVLTFCLCCIHHVGSHLGKLRRGMRTSLCLGTDKPARFLQPVIAWVRRRAEDVERVL